MKTQITLHSYSSNGIHLKLYGIRQREKEKEINSIPMIQGIVQKTTMIKENILSLKNGRCHLYRKYQERKIHVRQP